MTKQYSLFYLDGCNNNSSKFTESKGECPFQYNDIILKTNMEVACILLYEKWVYGDIVFKDWGGWFYFFIIAKEGILYSF